MEEKKIETKAMESKPNEVPKVEKTMKEKVDELHKMFQDPNVKKKELKLIRKAKVKGGKLRKGYIGIIKIDENMVASGEKYKIDDSTYRTKDGLFHVFDPKKIMMWQGKFPVIIQPTWKESPLDIRGDENKNETSGQKLIFQKMLREAIKETKSAGKIIWFIIGGIALFIIYNYMKSGKLF